MQVQDFISRYCKPTGVVREGFEGFYEVFTASPAAIMSVMPSVDSDEDPVNVGLDATWDATFLNKRRDNDNHFEEGYGPLVYLASEGFRVPLCILTEEGDVWKFHNGNHRLAAAIDLGYTEVPVVFMDRDDVDYDERWEVTEVRDLDYPVLIPPPAKAA